MGINAIDKSFINPYLEDKVSKPPVYVCVCDYFLIAFICACTGLELHMWCPHAATLVLTCSWCDVFEIECMLMQCNLKKIALFGYVLGLELRVFMVTTW